MNFDAVLSEMDLTPAQMARKLGVSSGHVADLQSGRRKLTLELASKLEPERPGLIAELIKERTGLSV